MNGDELKSYLEWKKKYGINASAIDKLNKKLFEQKKAFQEGILSPDEAMKIAVEASSYSEFEDKVLRALPSIKEENQKSEASILYYSLKLYRKAAEKFKEDIENRLIAEKEPHVIAENPVSPPIDLTDRADEEAKYKKGETLQPSGPDDISDPDQVLRNEMKALGLLCYYKHIIIHPEYTKKIGGKETVFHEQYWIFTSVEDVEKTLDELNNNGEIKIGDIELFMINRLRGKRGGDIRNSFKSAKSKETVKLRKNP